MKLRPTIAILALVLTSFTFSGCMEIFFDVVQHHDGTYSLRQSVAFAPSFFDMMAAFSKMGKDSNATITRESIVDSMRREIASKRDSVMQVNPVNGQAGITALSFYDTTVDSLVLFTVEARVSNVDSLPSALHLMQNENQAMQSTSAGTMPEQEDMRLTVTHAKGKVNLKFYSIAKPEDPANDSLGIQAMMNSMGSLFQGIKMHCRVFSESLEKPKDKKIKKIAGGQERVFGFDEMTKKDTKKQSETTFVIKE